MIDDTRRCWKKYQQKENPTIEPDSEKLPVPGCWHRFRIHKIAASKSQPFPFLVLGHGFLEKNYVL
jgi:hypothetical protein